MDAEQGAPFSVENRTTGEPKFSKIGAVFSKSPRVDPAVTSVSLSESQKLFIKVTEHHRRIDQLGKEKMTLQGQIRSWQRTIAGHQRRLEDPSIDERMRAALEFDVEEWEERIEQCKGKIASAEAKIQEVRRSLSVKEEELQKQQRKDACMKVIKEKKALRIRPVRFNNIGLPRSGKTSFRRRIMGEILNILWAIAMGEKEQPSTGVAEAGGQVFIRNKTSADLGTISSKVWSVLEDLEEEASMLSHVLYQTDQGIAPSSSSEGEGAEASFPHDPSAAAATGSPKSSKQKRTRLASVKHSLFKVLSTLTTRGSTSDKSAEDPELPESEIEEMLGAINEAIEGEDWDKIKYLLDDMVLLINTDTGGQAEFLELQGSLVQGPSFNLLFSRLVDELESQFEVYYTNEEGESTEKEDSIMTVEDVFFQSLSSIACYSGAFANDGDDGPSSSGTVSDSEEPSMESKCSYRQTSNNSKSKVMFVGTYRDKVTLEEFKEKDKLLQKKIKGTPFYDKGIIEFASKDQLMLPVDNMSGGQEEIDRIRKILEKVIDENFEEVTIPASWLVLSLQIRCRKLRTMSLEDCEKLAQKLGINPSELEHALWFLHHRVGVLLYYPQLEALRGTVICDIQVVFDSASNLIKNTFTFDKVGQRLNEKFSEKAQFSLQDVEKATLGYTDNLIPLEKLVQLLEYLGILTVIPPTSLEHSISQGPTYFMPCVLKSAKPSELMVQRNDSDPPPLMLRYDCSYVPVGIFSSMITSLVSQKLGGWRMIEKDIRKNRIQFRVGEDCDTVTLISRPRHLEIAISRSEGFQTPTESVCCHVRRVLQSTLSTVTSRMNYRFSMGYKFGFECPLHPGREHLCVLPHVQARRMECLQDEQKTFPLLAPHQLWLSCGSEADRIPLSMETLTLLKWKDECGCWQNFRIVDKVSSKWMKFGVRVGLTMDRLKGWEWQFQRDATRCWLEVMENWLNREGTGDYPVKWEGLCKLLADVGCGKIAKDLKKVLSSTQNF